MHQALIKISGRVQGVFYRAHAREEARALNLKGYIRNMPVGSSEGVANKKTSRHGGTPSQTVETLVQGEKLAIEKFAEWCRLGSPSSKVEKIEIIWQTPDKLFTTFSSQ